MLAALAIAGGWYWHAQRQGDLPDGFAVTNGRLEAERIDVAAKFAGRLEDVIVSEGQMVDLRRSEYATAVAAVASAKATIARTVPRSRPPRRRSSASKPTSASTRCAHRGQDACGIGSPSPARCWQPAGGSSRCST